jgi:hypothetical protein
MLDDSYYWDYDSFYYNILWTDNGDNDFPYVDIDNKMKDYLDSKFNKKYIKNNNIRKVKEGIEKKWQRKRI